nr:DUF927 domain-containing protein [Azospirillum argentinense]
MSKKSEQSDSLPEVTLTGFGRDERAGKTYRRYKVIDFKGVPRAILYAVEKGKDRASELMWRLEHQGRCKLPLASAAINRLINKIDAQNSTQEFVVTSQVGWVGDTVDATAAFCTPIRTYADSSQDIETDFQDVAVTHNFKVSGTLKQWQQHVAAFAHGNPLLMFVITVALASPLLKLLGVENGGFQLVGKSSTGKSSHLKAAFSIWGNVNEQGMDNWLMTENATDNKALTYCDTLLVLDEAGLAPGAIQQLLNTAYRLSSGTIKAKQTDTTRLRTYRLLFVSSAEHGLAKMAQDAGVQWNDGQLIRMIDIDANGGKNWGTFRNIHSATSPGEFADWVNSAATTYYGTAGDAFLEKLLRQVRENPEKLRAWLEKRRAYYRKHAPDVGLQSFHERVCKRFELVYAAGMLAIRYGVLPYSKKEMLEAVQYAHRKGMFEALAATSTPRPSAVQHVKAFIQNNKASFVVTGRMDKYEPAVLARAKAYWSKSDGGETFLFMPKFFKQEVCSGHSYHGILADLRREGFLHVYDGQGNTVTRKLPGHRMKKHVICIPARILNAAA